MHRNPHDTTLPLKNISFEDNLPITWELLTDLPSEGELHRAQRDNEALLHSLLLRDEIPQDIEDADVLSGHEPFKRLETRLDLLLSLVTEMMTASGKLPPSHAINLSAGGFCVQTQTGDAVDFTDNALLQVRLYLDPQFPRPLNLCVQLVDVQLGNFTVRFCPLEGRLQDLLDKYIFRQHRRAVALARKSENS